RAAGRLPEAPLPRPVVARLGGGPGTRPRLVGGVAGGRAPALGRGPRLPRAAAGGGRRTGRAVGAVAERPGGRGAGRHVAAARGHPGRRRPAVAPGPAALEARARRPPGPPPRPVPPPPAP